jgi:uncharacterized protein (TIGR03435 family)
MRLSIRGASVIVFAMVGAFCQSVPSARSFEVASVKLHQESMSRVQISTSGSRFNADAKSMLALIIYAYNLRNYQVSRTKALLALDDTFYDIAAKAAGDTVPTTDEFRQMLQSLLADRFKLRSHREMRETPVYALVLGKNGPKFKGSAPDASPVEHYAASGRNYQVTIAKATMGSVVRAIENSLLDRPVLDQTGLEGTYDIRMTYTPNIGANRGTEPDPEDTSIFTALEVQLGLKLVAQKAMVEIFVVDHVEKPSGN